MSQPDPIRAKIGVRQGGGPPPGYQWTVMVLDQAYKEATQLLDDDQYAHLVAQVKDLARESEPTRSRTVDVRAVEDFYEIRDKGGVLKRLNVRVFFLVHKAKRLLVILGAMNKTNDGPTPTVNKLLVAYRMKKFIASVG